MLAAKTASRIVDLSHPFGPDQPHWPGDPEVQVAVHARIEIHGYLVHEIRFGTHAGTHLGAPSHFQASGVGVEGISADKLVAQAMVMDVSAQASTDRDFCLRVGDVLAWEREEGAIPPGCLFLLQTSWDRYWGDPADFFGNAGDGIFHFPGIGIDAARYLALEREVVGIGSDTYGLDPGIDTAFPVGRFLAQEGRYHLECLRNLGALPCTGALVFVGALNILGASGTPARVIALVP